METVIDNSFWNKIFKGELENNRFGIISVALLIVGCLGGVVMWSGGASSTIQLIVTVIPTMLTLSFLLAVQPLKYIINLAIISICIDVILLAYNLLM